MDRIVIILTCTVHTNPQITFLFQKDVKSRKKAYVESIHQWVHCTNFKIIVVENSGYSFPEFKPVPGRLEILSFQHHLTDSRSKGTHELYAIQYALQHSTLVRPDSFVVKITGRYYIPNLESFLGTQRLASIDGLRQHDPSRCEMVGCHMSFSPRIFNPQLDPGDPDDFVEDVYKKRTNALPRILQCPVFPITPTQRGGVRRIFHNL